MLGIYSLFLVVEEKLDRVHVCSGCADLVEAVSRCRQAGQAVSSVTDLVRLEGDSNVSA
jgi:hypothetical protein